MLEKSPFEYSNSRKAHNQTASAQFFAYAETHRNDGVEGAEEMAQYILGSLRESSGVFFEDVGAMYPHIDHRILVRRENVETVMRGLLAESSIDIDPKGLYPNVAWWDLAHGSEGLKNAFLEGRAQLNGVVAVVGFEPSDSLVVVNQKDIPDEPGMFAGADGAALDRSFVASAHGVVPPEDIRFAVFRFPYHHFPESEMTDAELEGGEKNPHGKLQYIFRGIYFPKVVH